MFDNDRRPYCILTNFVVSSELVLQSKFSYENDYRWAIGTNGFELNVFFYSRFMEWYRIPFDIFYVIGFFVIFGSQNHLAYIIVKYSISRLLLGFTSIADYRRYWSFVDIALMWFQGSSIIILHVDKKMIITFSPLHECCFANNWWRLLL